MKIIAICLVLLLTSCGSINAPILGSWVGLFEITKGATGKGTMKFNIRDTSNGEFQGNGTAQFDGRPATESTIMGRQTNGAIIGIIWMYGVDYHYNSSFNGSEWIATIADPVSKGSFSMTR